MKATLKDKLSNYAGVLISISGSLLVMEQSGIILPKWLSITKIVLGAIGGGIIAYLTGKGNDGKSKTAA